LMQDLVLNPTFYRPGCRDIVWGLYFQRPGYVIDATAASLQIAWNSRPDIHRPSGVFLQYIQLWTPSGPSSSHYDLVSISTSLPVVKIWRCTRSFIVCISWCWIFYTTLIPPCHLQLQLTVGVSGRFSLLVLDLI
jgi:hypothetical protein